MRTKRAPSAIAARGLDAGVDDHLPRPLDFGDRVRRCDRVRGGHPTTCHTPVDFQRRMPVWPIE
jgi:hypothetical protein